jgi:hypothetical protein
MHECIRVGSTSMSSTSRESVDAESASGERDLWRRGAFDFEDDILKKPFQVTAVFQISFLLGKKLELKAWWDKLLVRGDADR